MPAFGQGIDSIPQKIVNDLFELNGTHNRFWRGSGKIHRNLDILFAEFHPQQLDHVHDERVELLQHGLNIVPDNVIAHSVEDFAGTLSLANIGGERLLEAAVPVPGFPLLQENESRLALAEQSGQGLCEFVGNA